MNAPILVLDNIKESAEDVSMFMKANDIFALKTNIDKFNAETINYLVANNDAFVYLNGELDNGIINYYKSRNIQGFYTDNISFALKFSGNKRDKSK